MDDTKSMSTRGIVLLVCITVIFGSMTYLFSSISRMGQTALEDVRQTESSKARYFIETKCGVSPGDTMENAFIKIAECIPSSEQSAKKIEVDAIIRNMVEARGVTLHYQNMVYHFGIVKMEKETNPAFIKDDRKIKK